MTDNDKAAEELRTVKTRVQRLEEARAAQPPEGSSVGGDQVLTPIERVVDRTEITDVVIKTVSRAPSSNVIDDFEDEDIGEYSGDTSGASIRNYPTQSGDASLSMKSDGSTPKNIVSTSGLNYYPETGDTYAYWAYVSNADNRAVHYFGASDIDNAYRVDLNPAEDRVRVSVVDSGNTTTLGEISASVSTNVWYEIEVDWGSSGGFTVELFEDDGTSLGTFTTTDDTYLSGGVGWGSAPRVLTTLDLEAIFDFARVTVATNVIDDFEDAGVTEYNGDTSSATVDNRTNIPTKHGDYALQVTGTATIYTSAGSLNNDAEAGETFETYHYLPTGSISRHLFGVQDGSNYYYVEADSPNGTWTIGKVENGGGSTISQATGVTVPNDAYLTFQVDWASDGTITAKLYDGNTEVSSVTGTDATWASGGHGWSEQGGSITSYFDYALEQTSGAQTTPATTIIIDDFEDGDISEYTKDYFGSGDPYSVTTAAAYEGTYGLEENQPDDNDTYYLYSTSGLPEYPSSGDTFQIKNYMDSSSGDNWQCYFLFGVSSNNDNNYRLVWGPRDDKFRLYKDGDNYVELASTPFDWTLHNDQWNTVEIDWKGSGDITCTMYGPNDSQIVQISTVDTTFLSGGIGFVGSGSASDASNTIYWDSAEITSDENNTATIDDFEDSDLSEYSGETSYHSFNTSRTKEGDVALDLTRDGDNRRMYSLEGDGLPNYPKIGDKFRYWWYSEQDAIHRFWYGIQNSSRDNAYRLDYEVHDNQIDVYIDGGDSNGDPQQTFSMSISFDTWYQTEIRWYTNGIHEIEVFDENGNSVGNGSFTDATYGDGGIAMEGSRSDFVDNIATTIDYIRVTDNLDGGSSVIDDFEDGDMSEYIGDTSEFVIQTSDVKNGIYAVEVTRSGSDLNAQSFDGLDLYPSKGDKFRYWWKAESGPVNEFAYAHQKNSSKNERYIIESDPANDEIRLIYDNGPDQITKATASVTLSGNTWYENEIAWTDNGDHELTVFDENGNSIASASYNNTDFSGGGIILQVKGADGTIKYDYIRVTGDT